MTQIVETQPVAASVPAAGSPTGPHELRANQTDTQPDAKPAACAAESLYVTAPPVRWPRVFPGL